MEHKSNETKAEYAAAGAVHKVKNAQQAVEWARSASVEDIVEQTAVRTKDALLEGLRDVFGEGDQKNPEQMKVLIQRVPILCANVVDMHRQISETKKSVDKIENNISWGIKIIIGAVILAIMKVILIP